MAEVITETNNLAGEYRDVVIRLTKHHDKWIGVIMQQ